MGDFLLGGGSLWAWVVRDWLSGGGPCRAPGWACVEDWQDPMERGGVSGVLMGGGCCGAGGVWGPYGEGPRWKTRGRGHFESSMSYQSSCPSSLLQALTPKSRG